MKDIAKINYDILEADYLSCPQVPFDDIDLIKLRISRLPEVQKRIFLLYIELGSLRKIAAILGCSHCKIAYIVNDIRKRIRVS